MSLSTMTVVTLTVVLMSVTLSQTQTTTTPSPTPQTTEITSFFDWNGFYKGSQGIDVVSGGNSVVDIGVLGGTTQKPTTQFPGISSGVSNDPFQQNAPFVIHPALFKELAAFVNAGYLGPTTPSQASSQQGSGNTAVNGQTTVLPSAALNSFFNGQSSPLGYFLGTTTSSPDFFPQRPVNPGYTVESTPSPISVGQNSPSPPSVPMGGILSGLGGPLDNFDNGILELLPGSGTGLQNSQSNVAQPAHNALQQFVKKWGVPLAFFYVPEILEHLNLEGFGF